MSVAQDLDALAPLTADQLAALFPVGRRPTRPLLIEPGGKPPLQYNTLAGLAAAVAGLLQGARPVLVRGAATYPGFDTFPAFSIHAEAPRGAAGGPPAATYLCAVAVQDTPAEVLDAAIAAAQARRAPA